MNAHSEHAGRADPECALCRDDGGRVLWTGPRLRVIDAGEPEYPGFTRVIWHAHVAEMTDLSREERDLIMHAVWLVEQAQRDVLRPDKINLAAFGNYVPHLHWHVIPRWRDDPQFPDAFWSPRRRPPTADAPQGAARLARLEASMPDYRMALATALDELR